MIFLGIGSNLDSKYGSRISNLNKIINLLQLEKIEIVKISSVYESPSYPNKKNPKFLNIVTEIKFNSDLNELFKKIAFIEEEMGRKRTYKNEPRTCDIDVIDFNQMVLDSEKICLPHPRTHERNFVLYPLQEINAQWTHPKSNKKIHTLIDNLSFDESNEITRLKERVILNK
jgi:2-amino-4-hydroxy-6-hydroxymethyldihydropteridine diphosphokinase